MKVLNCVAQNYAWGKLGCDSAVAALKSSANPLFIVDSSEPYAELWMGTHPSGPSVIAPQQGHEGDSYLLSSWLKNNPAASGTSNGELPFLFKVLSIRKALSIQAHPDMQVAQQLHAQYPEVYKDSNHKPEMAVALTKFEALCQFRTVEEIIDHLQSFPEFSALIDKKVEAELKANQTKESLRKLFESFIYAKESNLKQQLETLRSRLKTKQLSNSLSDIEDLVLRLDGQFRDDIGVFFPLLLNYIKLQPGDALFIRGNEPHAYISGDVFECMSCSDNTVRAGLTPKYKDTATLIKMLTYESGSPEISHQKVIQNDPQHVIYTPPVPEFEVEAITLSSDQEYDLPPRKTGSIFIVLSGTALAQGETNVTLQKGTICFVSASEKIHLKAGEQGILLYRASANETIKF